MNSRRDFARIDGCQTGTPINLLSSAAAGLAGGEIDATYLQGLIARVCEGNPVLGRVAKTDAAKIVRVIGEIEPWTGNNSVLV